MKFKSKITGAILEPASDVVVEQMKKSPDFEEVDDTQAPAQTGGAEGKKDLKKMKVDDLKAYAADLGITVPDGAVKADIVALIENAQAQDTDQDQP